MGGQNVRLKSWSLLAQAMVCLVACAAPPIEAVAGPPDLGEPWQLTFESNFDRPSAADPDETVLIEAYDAWLPNSDEAKWEYRKGANKKAFAIEENAFLGEDEGQSVLVLRTSVDEEALARGENPMRNGYIRTRNYENTGPNDEVLFGQRYGYFEARAKIDSTSGQWFAFWLMPPRGIWCADDSGRDATEIDIVEGFPRKPGGASDRNRSVNLAIHYDGYSRFHKSQHTSFPTRETRARFRNFDSSEYHIYGLLWTPEKYVWYVNGQPVYEINDPALISQVANYIKLTTEVADWAGRIDHSQYPADSKVDWVRAWQTDTLAAGNPHLFEAEDDRVQLSNRARIDNLEAGTWCRNSFARTRSNRPASMTVPIADPVAAKQIGIRVTNPSDATSSVRLVVDGIEQQAWTDIDLDPLFVLTHELNQQVTETIEVIWTGDIGIDQVYIVPDATAQTLR